MAGEIYTWYSRQYATNIQLLSQQKGSRFRNAVRVESVVGEMGFFDQVDAVDATDRTTRYGDTVWTIPASARRRVDLAAKDVNIPIDKPDLLSMVVDPTSGYVQTAVNALGRKMDDLIIAAATANAYTGQTGATSTAFDSNNMAITSGNNGADTMALATILSAKKALDKMDVDPDIPRYMAITPGQLSALLAIAQLTSTDYAAVKALVQGEIDTYCGFKFIVTNRLTNAGAANCVCLAWAKDGLLLGLGQDIQTSIDKRPDKNNLLQISCTMHLGATRMEEKKVVKITCNDA
jgi:hypothetical protein